jgi:ribosome biogenesis GTPase / thiamine phosphate phosphatase
MVQKDNLPKRWVGCDLEEKYFGDDRKISKKERKSASAKDRSKYKKTDRDKLKKQIEQNHINKTSNKSFLEGRVLSIVPEGIVVEYEHSKIICALRGILKKDKSQFKNLITVGDYVDFELISPSEGQISYVKSRRSILSRADNLSRRKEQLIAANIDQVLVTTSVVSPPLKSALVDRYIIAARKGNMEPVVVINKIDLLQNEGNHPDALILQEKELWEELVNVYKTIDIPVVSVSIKTGEGIDQLKDIMRNKASVFSGQSGVGKSSLINVLTGLDLETRWVVEKTQKGSHTTTITNLVPLEFGGWCIDTPGIKSFGVWDLSKDEVEQYFTEIYSEGHHCQYPDCAHIHEKNCAVHAAVEAGKISILRYNSYLSLIASISQNHLRR